MNSLKQRTISGLKWSFIDRFAKYGLSFFINIILARLLSPADYGLVGMIAIFFAISNSFIDSGFSTALIRKQNTKEIDLSSVFYFNLLISFLFFILLFSIAGLISDFFNEPKLTVLIRVIGLGLIIGASSTIQQTILTKRIDFKLQTKISVIATFLSGSVSVAMAYQGFGVWSLVAYALVGQTITSTLLWIWNKWYPKRLFSMDALKELFSFGSKLMVSGLINTIFINIYYLIIGKYFSSTELGYYTRADNFQKLPSENITAIIQRVSYPVLTSIQDDIPRLKDAYIKLIRSTVLITFVLMLGMVAVARPMIITLIGEKWEPCVIYLQMLCFVAMFYPLHALNLNMLEVLGRSDLFLRLEIIKKLLAVPVIIVGVIYGIKAMIVGLMVNTLIAYYLNSYWSGRFIGYSFFSQIKDILPSLILASVVSAIVFTEGLVIQLPPLLLLIIQLITGVVLTFGMCEAIQFKDYIYIKSIVTDKFLKSDP
jgi:O-antigen/teichoic acid export membrane protein